MTDSLKHIVGKSDSIGITDAEVAKIAGSNDWRTNEQRASWRRFITWLLGADHPWLEGDTRCMRN